MAIGRLTPTNCPFCRAGPVEGTNWPSMMPSAMATMIQMTRKRSRKDRPLSGGISFVAWLSSTEPEVSSLPDSEHEKTSREGGHTKGNIVLDGFAVAERMVIWGHDFAFLDHGGLNRVHDCESEE